MNKQTMAVKIAKDALANLENLNLATGYYINGFLPRSLQRDDDLQQYVPELVAKCRVCALGACLLSQIRVADNCKANELTCFGLDSPFENSRILAQGSEVRAKLLRFFSLRTITLMEMAFEGFRYDYPVTKISDRAITAVEAWRTKYPDPRKRFGRIMRNIIRNKGHFIPLKRKKKVAA